MSQDITLKTTITVPATNIDKAVLKVARGTFRLDPATRVIIFDSVSLGVSIGSNDKRLSMNEADLAGTTTTTVSGVIDTFVKDHIDDKGEVI